MSGSVGASGGSSPGLPGGELLADAIALLDPRTVAIGGAAPADRPRLAPGLRIGVGLQAAALELLHQGDGHGGGGGDVGNWSRRRSGVSLTGSPQALQGASFFQCLGRVRRDAPTPLH
jgi:hypothetical protein